MMKNYVLFSRIGKKEVKFLALSKRNLRRLALLVPALLAISACLAGFFK